MRFSDVFVEDGIFRDSFDLWFVSLGIGCSNELNI